MYAYRSPEERRKVLEDLLTLLLLHKEAKNPLEMETFYYGDTKYIGTGLCIILNKVFDYPSHAEIDHMYWIPELAQQKPGRAYWHDYWWPTTLKGLEKRIKAVEKAIQLTY